MQEKDPLGRVSLGLLLQEKISWVIEIGQQQGLLFV